MEVKTANEQAKEDFDENCKARCKVLEDQMLYGEVYSRWENFRFYGISVQGGRENIRQVLRDFVDNKLMVEASVIEFQRVHRLIVARFLRK